MTNKVFEAYFRNTPEKCLLANFGDDRTILDNSSQTNNKRIKRQALPPYVACPVYLTRNWKTFGGFHKNCRILQKDILKSSCL